MVGLVDDAFADQRVLRGRHRRQVTGERPSDVARAPWVISSIHEIPHSKETPAFGLRGTVEANSVDPSFDLVSRDRLGRLHVARADQLDCPRAGRRLPGLERVEL